MKCPRSERGHGRGDSRRQGRTIEECMPGTVEPNAASTPLSMASGADQTGVRLYNERLILSLVRRFGRLSKIEVARMTGLSVQSTSAIMNRLQADGLLRREAPMRGRVGQPTVPLS